MGFFSFFCGTKHKDYDTEFRKNIHKYDQDSYRKDLDTKNRDKKIRAIWGIEGSGNSDNIRDLERIAHDSKEDKSVRKEAEIAVRNLKKRSGK